MPRRKADEPRDRPLLLRLTSRQLEVLGSVAHLARATPNAYVHQLLAEHLAGMLKNPHVKADLENRASFDAAATAATPLRSKRARNVEPATPEAAPKGRRTRKSRGSGAPAP